MVATQAATQATTSMWMSMALPLEEKILGLRFPTRFGLCHRSKGTTVASVSRSGLSSSGSEVEDFIKWHHSYEYTRGGHGLASLWCGKPTEKLARESFPTVLVERAVAKRRSGLAAGISSRVMRKDSFKGLLEETA